MRHSLLRVIGRVDPRASSLREGCLQISQIARAAVRAGAANAVGEKRAFRPAARDPRWVPNPARPSRCRRVFLDRVPPAHADRREPLPVLSSRSGHTSQDNALPSRAVPVLGGRARLERATCCGASLRHVAPKPIGAGKPARRFLAASPVPVIRVDSTRPPAHQCACRLSPKRIRIAAPASAASVRAATVFRTAEAGRGRPVPARPAHGGGESIASRQTSDICHFGIGSPCFPAAAPSHAAPRARPRRAR